MSRLILIPLLAAFSALTLAAVWQHGYWGIFEGQLSDLAGLQVLADLGIALCLFLTWMWRDAQARGRNPWPWLLLTLASGSLGALLYLLVRGAAPIASAPRRSDAF